MHSVQKNLWRLTRASASKNRAYDSENRLAALAFTNSRGRVCAASYAYADARETNLTVTLPNGSIFTRSLTRDAHRPALVTRHDYAFNGSPVLWYACNHDILGRVTNAWDSLSVVRAFLYNSRSEVTGATVGTNSFGYGVYWGRIYTLYIRIDGLAEVIGVVFIDYTFEKLPIEFTRIFTGTNRMSHKAPAGAKVAFPSWSSCLRVRNTWQGMVSELAGRLEGLPMDCISGNIGNIRFRPFGVALCVLTGWSLSYACIRLDVWVP